MTFHTNADHRDFGDLCIVDDIARLEAFAFLLGDIKGFVEIILSYGKGDIIQFLLGHVLNDHIYNDIGVAQTAKYFRGNSRPIGHAENSNLCLVAVIGHATDNNIFHIFLLLHYHGAGVVIKAGSYMNRHVVFLCKFHGTRIEHLGALAGKFQHFVV